VIRAMFEKPVKHQTVIIVKRNGSRFLEQSHQQGKLFPLLYFALDHRMLEEFAMTYIVLSGPRELEGQRRDQSVKKNLHPKR
jgi:hypothetical protein